MKTVFKKFQSLMKAPGKTSRNRQRGFSVIEMLVGITIFTIVMGSIYGLLQLGRAGRLNTNMRAEVLQNARIAINTMGRDIINSGVGYPNIGALVPDNRVTGLLGGTNDTDSNADFLTPIYGRNNVASINGVATDQITIAFVDNSFNGGVTIPISSMTGNGLTLTIQNGFTNTACTVGDIYLIGGQTSTSALGMLTAKAASSATPPVYTLTFASTDPLNINQPGANSAINLISLPGSLQRVFLVTYRVVDEDGSGQGSGTLVRDVYGGSTGFTTQPLAFGIENFQVQYIMASTTGSEVIVDAPAADQMLNIRQVRLSLTVRSPEIDPRTKQPFRETISATYSARNLEYEKF
jgi:prepilin-type N-terminal cleavage/methylation domain-containing protein